MFRSRSLRRLMPCLFLVCWLPTVGCYGPFKLTTRLHEWNGTLGDPWVNELVFLALIIVPIYELAALGDAIIFNSVQFWTGENPLDQIPPTEGAVRVIRDGEREIAFTLHEDEIEVSIYEAGVLVSEHRLNRGERSLSDNSGRYAEFQDDGSAVVKDRRGEVLASFSPDEVRSVVNAGS